MATQLCFLSGRQITNDAGTPQSGAKLYFYRETTTTALTVWTDDAASVAHSNPVVCDSGGFVPLIYIDDTYDYKVVIKTSADVTLQTYDEIPAPAATSTTGYYPELRNWYTRTNVQSPVALTAADAGNAYEADTTAGDVEFDLPSAATVGNGKGFTFKKIIAANSMIIDQSGTETIDDDATAITVTALYAVVHIVSNGAEWYVIVDPDFLKSDVTDDLTVGFTSTAYDAGTQASGTFTPDPANGNIQTAVNGGAHTLAPPSSTCTMIVQYTNNASAGAITTSGFTAVDGDALTTTDGDDFMFYITKIGSFSRLTVAALQ